MGGWQANFESSENTATRNTPGGCDCSLSVSQSADEEIYSERECVIEGSAIGFASNSALSYGTPCLEAYAPSKRSLFPDDVAFCQPRVLDVWLAIRGS